MIQTKMQCNAIDPKKGIKRCIGTIKGDKNGPTVILTAGIHGNEPAGIFGMLEVLNQLKSLGTFGGSVIALAGNLCALKAGKRFCEKDLNRMWSAKAIENLEQEKQQVLQKDYKEQFELWEAIQEILNTHNGPFYFMDIHTTSSESIPFLTINDSLLNREFTKQYPLPIVLGIEEFLDGPLLSYINSLGYVAFGFEAGQHWNPKSIDQSIAFIYLSLVFTGVLSKHDIPFDYYYSSVYNRTRGNAKYFEIFYRHEINTQDNFKMQPGFLNFSPVKKGQHLAINNLEEINARTNAQIFMPLYQGQGDDGFFLIRPITPFFLKLSAVLRRTKVDRILTWLPGVSWYNRERSKLQIDKRVAVFFRKKILHLLGYRSKSLDKNTVIVTNREAASKRADYKEAPWLKSKAT